MTYYLMKVRHGIDLILLADLTIIHRIFYCQKIKLPRFLKIAMLLSYFSDRIVYQQKGILDYGDLLLNLPSAFQHSLRGLFL